MRNFKWLAWIGLAMAGTHVPAAAQRVRWDENEVVREAVIEAQNRLQHRSCARLLRPDAGKVLLSATFSFLSLGKPHRLANGKLEVINAATVRENNTIIINIDGAFWNPQMAVNHKRFDGGLSATQVRALWILHELGHLTGVFAHDAEDSSLNRIYTKEVLESCF